jgi:hypothetical protein
MQGADESALFYLCVILIVEFIFHAKEEGFRQRTRILLYPSRHSLSTSPPIVKPNPRWVWLLLLGWLVYTFAAMGWYVLNDPVFMGSFCRST